MADDNKDKYITEKEQVIPPVLVSAPPTSNGEQKTSQNFDVGELTPEILRSSFAPYKAAATDATNKDVIFLTPSKMNEMGFDALYIETAKEIMGHNRSIQQAAEIIKDFKGDEDNLIGEINNNIKDLRTSGPAAKSMLDVCLINESDSPEQEKNDINEILGTSFKNTYIKATPGEYKDWQILTGAHEGEHCNQDNIKINFDDGLSPLKVSIMKETLSDRHAFDVLKKMGKDDVIQTWKDFRAITAIYDTTHATNIFLDQENSPEEITNLQAIAAQTFNFTAIRTVSRALNISDKDAEDMQLEYPKEFTKILKEEMRNNHIVSDHMPENTTYWYQREALYNQMGITNDEFAKLTANRIPDIVHAYRSLEENGKIPKENPYVLQYISQYIDAVDRRLGDDKTPYTPYPQQDKKESAADIEERKNIAKELGIPPADIDKQQPFIINTVRGILIKSGKLYDAPQKEQSGINITEPSDPAEKPSMNLHGQSAPTYFNAHASVTEYPEESLKIAIAKPNIQQQATFTV